MEEGKTGPRKGKPGRKSAKVRSNVSLTENLNAAAEYLGRQAFGNKTTYLEHLIMRDLERNGLTIAEVVKLAEQSRAAAEALEKTPKKK